MSKKVKCLSEDCTAMILLTTAKGNDGLCCPCKYGTKKTKKKGEKEYGLIIWITAIAYFGFWVAIGVAMVYAIISPVYDYVFLPEKLERNGILTEAVFWEVEHHRKDNKSRKKTIRRITYWDTYNARFLSEDKSEHYEIHMEKGVRSYPFTKYLVMRQPFLIRYLSDDPWVFNYAYRHEKEILTDTINTVLEQELFNKALIQADPVVLSSDRKSGFSVIHVSDKMLKYSWLKHPSIQDKLNRLNINDQPIHSRAYIGLRGSRYGVGPISSPDHLHPEDSEKQDAFGILNLVKPRDEVVIELHSEVQDEKNRSHTIIAIFRLSLSSEKAVIRTPDMLDKFIIK